MRTFGAEILGGFLGWIYFSEVGSAESHHLFTEASLRAISAARAVDDSTICASSRQTRHHRTWSRGKEFIVQLDIFEGLGFGV